MAYSVYSYFSAEKGHGTFELVMQTKNETALEAIRIAKAEIRRMRESSSLRKSFQMRRIILSGAFRCASIPTAKSRISWLQVEYFQLGLDYPERYADFIKQVTREDVQRGAEIS